MSSLPTLTRLSNEQQDEVIRATQSWITKASALFDCRIQNIDIEFDLKGRTSGMFCIQGRRKWIRYNPWIFAKHYHESMEVTVPHEVAHYVCYKLHRRKTRPHGKEWKAIMAEFGVDSRATCKLDITDLPQRRLTRFEYQCGCNSYQLTSIRHNRIMKGISGYSCPKCREKLIHVQN